MAFYEREDGQECLFQDRNDVNNYIGPFVPVDDTFSVEEIMTSVVNDRLDKINSVTGQTFPSKYAKEKPKEKHPPKVKITRNVAITTHPTLPSSHLQLQVPVDKPPTFLLRKNDVHGFIDVDSILVCGRSLRLFQPQIVTKVKTDIYRYDSKMKNVKAISGLANHVMNYGYSPADVLYVDFGIANFDLNEIYALCVIDRNLADRTNYGASFSQEVLGKSLISMNKMTETSMFHVGGREKRHTFGKVFQKEYPEFCKLVEILTSEWIKKHKNVIDVLFYQCNHGLRSPMKTAIEEVKKIVDKREKHILTFIQLHFGISLKCPKNTIFLVNLPKTSLISNQVTNKPSFFLHSYGYAFGKPKNFKKIEYFQIYETISHKITDKDHEADIMTSVLVNGFTGDWQKYRVKNMKVKDWVTEIEAYLSAFKTSADMRIEVVQNISWDEVIELESMNFTEEWFAKDPEQYRVIQLTYFVRQLLKSEILVMMTNWSSYVNAMVQYDMEYIKAAVSRQRLFPMQSFLNKLYTMQQRIIFFIEGDFKRHDKKHIAKLTIPSNKPFHVISRSEAQLDEDHFKSFCEKKYANLSVDVWKYMYVLYKNARRRSDEEKGEGRLITFSPIYNNILSSANDPKVATLYLFQTIAIMTEWFMFGKECNRTCTDPMTYFIQQRSVNMQYLGIVESDVVQSIVKPKIILTQLTIQHCLGTSLSDLHEDTQLLQEVKRFTKHYVKFWPTRYCDGACRKEKWSLVLSHQEKQKKTTDGFIELSGRAKRQVNLRKYEHIQSLYRGDKTTIKAASLTPAKKSTHSEDKDDVVLQELLKELSQQTGTGIEK